jgi:predicted transposase/invertase (TIGR01784 family)
MKTDSLFYRLLQAQPTLAFQLAEVDVPASSDYRFISQEIKQTSFRLDGIAEPPADRPDAPRGYIEVQFQPDEDFYSRFFTEILLHLRQYPSPHPWQAVVIYPSANIERHAPATEPLLSLPNLRRVYLDQLPLLDSANPTLWVLALIVAETDAIPAIVRKIQTHNSKPDADWLDLLETVLVYKLPKLTREEIQKMLNFTDISLKDTRFYRDVFAEGRQEGHQEGRLEGRQEGHQEGEAAVLLRLLERKFRPLPDSARQRIASADAETLLVWAERLLDANSLDDIWGS